jgi:hypothetical protein
MGGEGQLQEDAINAIVSIEAINFSGDRLGAGGGVQMLPEGSDPDPFAGTLFVTNVYRTGGIISHP